MELLDGSDREVFAAGSTRPHGRGGPHVPTPQMSPSSSSSADIGTLMATTMLPMAMLVMERLAGGSADGGKAVSPSTAPKPALLLPAPGQELRACLTAFRDHKGIDLLVCEDTLMSQDFTPDIIPIIPVTQLITLLAITEGKVRKLQAFCQAWNAQLEENK